MEHFFAFCFAFSTFLTWSANCWTSSSVKSRGFDKGFLVNAFECLERKIQIKIGKFPLQDYVIRVGIRPTMLYNLSNVPFPWVSFSSVADWIWSATGCNFFFAEYLLGALNTGANIFFDNHFCSVFASSLFLLEWWLVGWQRLDDCVFHRLEDGFCRTSRLWLLIIAFLETSCHFFFATLVATCATMVSKSWAGYQRTIGMSGNVLHWFQHKIHIRPSVRCLSGYQADPGSLPIAAKFPTFFVFSKQLDGLGSNISDTKRLQRYHKQIDSSSSHCTFSQRWDQNTSELGFEVRRDERYSDRTIFAARVSPRPPSGISWLVPCTGICNWQWTNTGRYSGRF